MFKYIAYYIAGYKGRSDFMEDLDPQDAKYNEDKRRSRTRLVFILTQL